MREYLQQLMSFGDEELDAILSYGTRREAKRGTVLFDAERPFMQLWFVEAGLIRSYRLVGDKDFTFFFFTPHHFAVDYQSYLTEQPSSLWFEAMTEVSYLSFPKRAMQTLYERFPRFERLGKLMAEQAYLSATERLKQHQVEPLEIRYQRLIARDPKLFQAVPQYHIASYLGVSPQSLSRVKAKLAGKNY